ncbi:hypothetical protein TYRP_018377 [Tyrophagus putrescentiae]|nr:hypothetical protein TYRP_018377 [Tyrophagus putrescentiae]
MAAPTGEEFKPVYSMEKIQNIMQFLGRVKDYSSQLFADTLEILYQNQEAQAGRQPFLYLYVYEELMTLYADHPTLRNWYRHYFGPVNVLTGEDGSLTIQLPVNEHEPPIPCAVPAGTSKTGTETKKKETSKPSGSKSSKKK